MSPGEQAARSALLATARAMNGLGINHGKTGNVSVRCARGARPGLLITPSGLPYERSEEADLVWLALDVEATEIEAELDQRAAGRALDGRYAPSSEWRFHRDILATRDDVEAVVHTHAQACAALSCLPAIQRDGIPAFHYMVAAAGGDDVRCARYEPFGSAELSQAALQALAGRRACLLAHHGLIALGATLEAALALAVELEWLAATYAQALTVGSVLGGPARLDAAQMDEVLTRFRSYGSARLR
jgi:L-fuculose-phosphate aldolase